MTPEEEKELAELEELERLEAEEAAASPGDQAKATEVAPLIDPNLSLPAQVLATQPATTHPKGDEAAQSDWAVKGTDAAKGTTIVYEPPVAQARKELMENPQLLTALFPDEQIPPEFIQQMDENSDIYKTYADHKWNDARWAAADSGTTAYRQSKMPWLHGESAGLSPVSTLVTKLRASIDPALEGAQAFILGVDDTAAFGAGRRAGEALDRATPTDPNGAIAAGNRAGDAAVRGGESVGGVGGEAQSGADPEAINEMLIEQSPVAHTAGQIVGMFTPTGVLGLLGRGASATTKAAGALATRLGGGVVAQGAAKLAGAGAGAVLTGGAAQAGREGVEAAANLGKTGETGTTFEGASDRVEAAALDPVNLGLGVGGEVGGMLAARAAKGIRDTPRYGGNIERVERLGGEMKFGKGPVGTQAVEDAIKVGKERDITATAVMSEQLAPKIAEAENAVASGNFTAAKAAKEAAKNEHANFKSKYFSSPEGQAVLPPVATMETNLKHLRDKMTTTPEGGLRTVGNAEGVATARAEFSGDVAEVSLKPKPGAIELTPDEAEMFLSPSLTNSLVPKPKAPPPAPPAPQGGAREIGLGPGEPAAKVNQQGVNVIKPQSAVPVGEAPTVPPKGKAAKPAGKVEAIPDRDLKPTIQEYSTTSEARNEYGNAMAPYRDAQRADNARAANMAKAEGLVESPKEPEKAAARGLSTALKQRGVSKVYVVPRRYNAQQHEVRIGQLKDLTKDPKLPGAREAKERYAAALQDRAQRPLDGKPGGWSEAQQQVNAKLTALEERLALAETEAQRKATAKREAPGGTAAKRLVRYSKQSDAELPLKKEIEAAGAKAGVLPELQNLRLLDPLQQLRESMSYRGKVAPRSKVGLIGAMADTAALRYAYPTANWLGNQQLSPLRGGMLGVKANQLGDNTPEEQRK